MKLFKIRACAFMISAIIILTMCPLLFGYASTVTDSDKSFTFLKYDIQCIEGSDSAVLEFYAKTDSPGTVKVYATDEEWAGDTITAKNMPHFSDAKYIGDINISDTGLYQMDVSNEAKNSLGENITFLLVSDNHINIKMDADYKPALISFDDMGTITTTSSSPVSNERNIIYSNTYDIITTGSTQPPAITLIDGFDHTSGSGKCVKLETKFASWNNNKYTEAMVKFFNSFRDSSFTQDDIGRTYKVSFWVYAENLPPNTPFIWVGVAGAGKILDNEHNGTHYYRNGRKEFFAAQKVELAEHLDEWINVEFEYTLDEVNVSPYQFGLLSLTMGNGTADEGHRIYLDDISVTDVTNTPVLKIERDGTQEIAAAVEKKSLDGIGLIRIKETETEGHVLVEGDLRELEGLSEVDIYIIKDGFTENDYTNPEAVYAHRRIAVQNGFYETRIDLSDADKFKNDFTVVLKHADDLYAVSDYYFENANFKRVLLNRLAAAENPMSFKNTLESSEQELELNLLEFTETITENSWQFVCNYAFKNKDKIIDNEDFFSHLFLHNTLLQGYLFDGFYNKTLTDEQVIEILQNNAETFNMAEASAFTKTFADSQEATKAKVITSLKGALFDSLDDFVKGFTEAIIKTYINSDEAFNYSIVLATLHDNIDCLGLDNWSLYENLSNQHKPAIGKQIADFAKKTSSLKNINNEIQRLVQGVDSKGQRPAPSGPASNPRVTGTFTFSTDSYAEDIEHSTDAPAVLFTDIEHIKWANNIINTMVGKGIINGYGDSTFKPDNPVTRKEFAKMLVLSFNIFKKESACSFLDIKQNDWSYGFVASLSELGIANGIGNNLFGADLSITRQDAIVLISRLVNEIGLNIGKKIPAAAFSDEEDISPYAAEAIKHLHEADALPISEGNLFKPLQPISRLEAIQVLHEIIIQSQEQQEH